MNWRWKIQNFKEWTVFLWKRFPAMFLSEIEYRILVLVAGHNYPWQCNRLSLRISNITDSFAVYQTIAREADLRSVGAECWGGDTYDPDD